MTPDNDVDDARSLPELVTELTDAVKRLTAKFERKRISDAVLGVVVAAMAAAISLYYFVELPGRREDIRSQLRDSNCYNVRLTPPGLDPQVDDIRQRYDCDPYRRPSSTRTATPSSVPQPRTTAVPRPTATVTRPAAASATRTTVQATRTVSAPRPAATRTVTVRPPARTVTARVTVTAPAPTPTCRAGLLGPLLCP